MIYLLPSPEQQQIIDSVVEFFERSLPVARLRVRNSAAGGIAKAVWQEIASLGWFGLSLPESGGGAGYSLVEEMLVHREYGRYVASPSLLAASLATHVALESNKGELLAGILDGELRVGLANALPAASDAAAKQCHLLDAGDSQLILYWDQRGVSLYERSAFADPVGVPSLDEIVQLDRARLTAATPVAFIEAADQSLSRRAALLVCAQLVGVAEAAKDQAVAYAKAREQFGQPIGAFQTIKHECAELALQCEAAYAQTFLAGLCEVENLADAPFQAAVAGLLAGGAALKNARANIQIHGGIGFTSECDAHRYLKRAHLLRQLGGGVGTQRTRLLTENSVYG